VECKKKDSSGISTYLYYLEAIEKISKILASGQYFLNPYPTSSKMSPTNQNVGRTPTLPLPNNNFEVFSKGHPKNSSCGTKLLCTPSFKSCSLFETP